MQIFNKNSKEIKIFGVKWDEELGGFGHMPVSVGRTISEAVEGMSRRSVGGRLRFRTDSRKFKITITVDAVNVDIAMSLIGASGCDVYYDQGKQSVYKGAVAPKTYDETTFSAEFETRGCPTSVTVNLCRNEMVKDFQIEIEDEAKMYEPPVYSYDEPIVFYGSSITEGGCATRPGNAYTSLVPRWLDSDYINLGFSGAAKGEQAMARYIATLPMRLFVMDYDHNEYTAGELRERHEPFFKTIREARPNLPIILMTRPDCRSWTELSTETREIIRTTYRHAIASGDTNVYFLDGYNFFKGNEEDISSCTVDGCHPNDLGFNGMAHSLCALIEELNL